MSYIKLLHCIISEQQEAVCYRREFTEVCITLFSSRVFYGAPCSSVFLLGGKSRALIYLHTFMLIMLASIH